MHSYLNLSRFAILLSQLSTWFLKLSRTSILSPPDEVVVKYPRPWLQQLAPQL